MSDYVPRLKTFYEEEVPPLLMKELNLKNKMQVPRLSKVVLSMGLGAAVQNSKYVDSALTQLSEVTGRKAVVTRAKKSIAGFKLRQGMAIGAMVTLRRNWMWDFVERLFVFGLPRVRDFKGVSPKAFDNRGNYTLGIRESTIFPEVDYDNLERVEGMNAVFVTTAKTDDDGRALLRLLGMPFRK